MELGLELGLELEPELELYLGVGSTTWVRIARLMSTVCTQRPQLTCVLSIYREFYCRSSTCLLALYVRALLRRHSCCIALAAKQSTTNINRFLQVGNVRASWHLIRGCNLLKQ